MVTGGALDDWRASDRTASDSEQCYLPLAVSSSVGYVPPASALLDCHDAPHLLHDEHAGELCSYRRTMNSNSHSHEDRGHSPLGLERWGRGLAARSLAWNGIVGMRACGVGGVFLHAHTCGCVGGCQDACRVAHVVGGFRVCVDGQLLLPEVFVQVIVPFFWFTTLFSLSSSSLAESRCQFKRCWVGILHFGNHNR